jgi:hypothetical protein
MTVRPKDLAKQCTAGRVLSCGECVIDYSAQPDAYVWMFPGDPIVCEACGTELVLEEITLIEDLTPE